MCPRPGTLRMAGLLFVFIMLFGSMSVALCASARDVLFGSAKGFVLKQGDTGQGVKALQEVLNALGYSAGTPDGIFGGKTKTAVLKFQKDRGLTSDGVVGPSTLSSLSALYDRKHPPSTHAVKRGETLWDIGERYGISVANLMAANCIKNANLIYVGQLLTLKAGSVPSPTEPPESETTPVVDVPKEPTFPTPVQGVCLTFNDGPDETTTRSILSTLNKYGVKATFFVIGKNAAKHPELLRQIADRGHVIGVHGFEHKVLAGCRAEEVAEDLKKAVDVVTEITGKRPWLYRPPGGLLDETQVREAAKLGLQVVMWTNIGGADLDASSPQAVVDRVLASSKQGGIILLHEGLSNTAQALPLLIESLANSRFGFRNLTR